jgi:hypothetical protein
MGQVLIPVGIAAVLYGSYTFWLRRSHPERFGKLAPLKNFLGAGFGSGVHVVAYSVLPIAFGVSMISLGSVSAPPDAARQQTDEVQLSPEQRARLRFGMAQGELMAAGFTLVGGVKEDRIDVVDGDFKAAIVSSGRGWRVERSGHAPIDQVRIDEAVSKIFEAHRPKR